VYVYCNRRRRTPTCEQGQEPPENYCLKSEMNGVWCLAVFLFNLFSSDLKLTCSIQTTDSSSTCNFPLLNYHRHHELHFTSFHATRSWWSFLLYSHPILLCLLARLYNVILRRNHVPSAFKFSYNIPIPKLQDCRTKAVTTDSFRGTAISPIISKVFEHCSLGRFGHVLKKSDNQFVFIKRRLVLMHSFQYLKQLSILLMVQAPRQSICVPWLIEVNHHSVGLLNLWSRLNEETIPNELLSVLENWLGDCYSLPALKGMMRLLGLIKSFVDWIETRFCPFSFPS